MGRIFHNLLRERAILAVILTLAIFNANPMDLAKPTNDTMGLIGFFWLFGVMIWGASAVVHHAEALAERLGEPCL